MGRMSIFFAFLAAVLVATGLYGTLAYRVSRRTAEIGVRMALGAQRQQVLWMVLRESLMVGAAGLAVGLPLAIAGARLLRSTLFGLGPNDPLSFGAALAWHRDRDADRQSHPGTSRRVRGSDAGLENGVTARLLQSFAERILPIPFTRPCTSSAVSSAGRFCSRTPAGTAAGPRRYRSRDTCRGNADRSWRAIAGPPDARFRRPTARIR